LETASEDLQNINSVSEHCYLL